MKKIVLIALFIAGVVATGHAVPVTTLEYGTVPERVHSPDRDECHLRYYNICSGWLFSWGGYCVTFDLHDPMYGTCFDLADCPGRCRHLEDVWFACRAYVIWGTVDIEIYCADEDACPVGPPLAGIYGTDIPYGNPWIHLNFGGLPLCPCEEQGADKFIVMITEPWAGWHDVPYSDVNSYNIYGGCETEWRCTGHSYVYRNAIDYCQVYGVPGPLWEHGAEYGCTDYPTVPPCWTLPTNGFYCEWLIDCYINCQGATATDRSSWSEVKRLYK
jgi:hypothetical protein